MNSISKEYIEKELSGSLYKIEVEQSVTSTNSIMKDRAKKEGGEFSVLIASHQSSGRGRLGRSFHSPSDTGLYMSILLKPQDKSNPLFITTDAAVCCASVFERMSKKKALIKWVNDIYIDNRKVCGILTEGAAGENGYAVLGIGINVTPPEDGFPEDIKDRAGCVFDKAVPFLREKVAVEILKEFYKIYTCGNRSNLLCEYRERSMVIGKEIEIIKDDTHEKALVLSIDEDYSLVIKKQNGDIVRKNSGEISIKIEQN